MKKYFQVYGKQLVLCPCIREGGPKQNVENYRPISTLTTLTNIFERLVHRAIYPSLYNTIIIQQHLFVQRRSTVINISTQFIYLIIWMQINIPIAYILTFKKPLTGLIIGDYFKKMILTASVAIFRASLSRASTIVHKRL